MVIIREQLKVFAPARYNRIVQKPRIRVRLATTIREYSNNRYIRPGLVFYPIKNKDRLWAYTCTEWMVYCKYCMQSAGVTRARTSLVLTLWCNVRS